MSRPKIELGPPLHSEASNLEKSHSNSLFFYSYGIRNIYIWSPRHNSISMWFDYISTDSWLQFLPPLPQKKNCLQSALLRYKIYRATFSQKSRVLGKKKRQKRVTAIWQPKWQVFWFGTWRSKPALFLVMMTSVYRSTCYI